MNTRPPTAAPATEDDWRGIVESLREGFILAEVLRDADDRPTDWRYIDVNEVWSRFVGVRADAARGRTVREVLPGIEDEWVELGLRVVATRQTETFEREVGATGRWYEGSASWLSGDRFVISFSDSTERRRAEVRREAMLELTDALQATNDPGAQIRAGTTIIGRVLDVDVCGYGTMQPDRETLAIEHDWTRGDASSLVGDHWLPRYGDHLGALRAGRAVVVDDVDHDDSMYAAARKAIGAAAAINLPIIERGEFVAMFFVTDRRTRRWADAQDDMAFLKDGADRIRSAVERRRAEMQLEALSANLARQVAERTLERDTIWKVSRDMFCVADTEGVWLDANPAWTRVLGWTTEELIGRTSAWIEHPDDTAKTQAEIDELARGNLTVAFTNRFRDRSGAYHWLSWTAVPEGGKHYCIARDVTPERRQAAALREAQDSLRQAQKMEAVGQLTGGVAHDFNNLLGTIKNCLEVIREARQPGLERVSDMAMRNVERAAALTRRLLALSRKQPLKLEAVRVNELVLSLEDMLSRTLSSTTRLAVRCDPKLACAWIDANQLENALLNLALNARDAMPDGGLVTVETSRLTVDSTGVIGAGDLTPGDYAVVSVSDDGHGMTDEVLARAFDPFFTTKPMGEGTGLGLSMIYSFAKQSGGAATIYSQPAAGTTVKLFLPLADRAGGGPVDTPPATAPLHGAGEKILLVEDETDLRMIVTELLESRGFRVAAMATAEDALRSVSDGAEFDALVTDIRLPGMNGRALLEKLRESRADLAALLITGYDVQPVPPAAEPDPRTALLTKPFAIDQLIAQVLELISR